MSVLVYNNSTNYELMDEENNMPDQGWSASGGKQTKIIATIGPVSEDKEILKKMIESGMNAIRLNFAHGEHDWHEKIIKTVRELSKEMDVPIGILADLQGPRIRVGNVEEFEVKKGEIILVSDKKNTDRKELVIDSDKVSSALQPEERILIEDGLIEIKITKRDGDTIEAEVINGGIIKPRKGINVPDTNLHFGAVTTKDEKDLEFLLKHEIDFIGLSFVSNAKEIKKIKDKIKNILGREKDLPQIVAKIERKEAIKNIDEIIKAADAVMVARGDLGIEMNETKVVVYQKEIIKKCLEQVKPVIVATQMLESMKENPIPTRAEVSDVSNAVIDHTDAVTLSGESANGKYPIKAVETMREIIQNTEESPFDDINSGFLDDDMFTDYASLISSAHELAKTSKAKAIIMYSESGFTGRMMSHHRPEQMMLVATNKMKTYNQLSMIWGVEPYLFNYSEDGEKFIDLLIEKAKKDKKLSAGDKVVAIVGKSSRGKNMKLVGIQEV